MGSHEPEFALDECKKAIHVGLRYFSVAFNAGTAICCFSNRICRAANSLKR
jgi:hypothetical protein